MSDTRWVLVDDTDPSLTYTGPWFQQSDGFNAGNWGAPYGDSEHGSNGTASVSFPFTGIRLRVLGTSAVKNTSGVIDPSWQCLVDSVEMSPSAPWTSPINNWPLCESPQYSPGQHTFTLDTSSTQDTTLWFDQIRYQPLANMSSSLTNPTVIIEQSDPAVQYVSGNWQDLQSSAMLTLQTGAVMAAKFEGTQLIWVAWTPSGYPTGTSQASYSVDGGAAVPFQITGLPSGSATLYNQHLFETPVLSPGSHTLTVTYNGPSAPLTLDHLLVINGSIIIPGSSTSPGSTTPDDGPNPSDATNGGTSKQPPIGGIVGGAVGGIAVVILAVLLLVLFLRWRKRTRALTAAIDVKPPVTGFPPAIAQVTPFGYGSSVFPTAGNVLSPQSALSSLPSSSGWSEYVPMAPRRDQKIRPSQQPSYGIHNYHTSSHISSSVMSGSTSDLLSRDGDTHYAASHPVHHEDSGIRLTAPEVIPDPEAIMDVPPLYTAS